MVTTIGPYAIFLPSALEIAGIGDEFWADALAEEVETGRALTQQVIEQLPRSLDQEECALLILGELMSGVSPYAEPVTLAHATERDALRLRESFRQVLDRMLDDRFIHLQPQGDTPEAPVTDYSDGSMWWSSPSLRGFTPNTLADGDVITRCFRRNYQILGGVPLSSILGDDSIMTVLEQVELWKRQEDRGPVMLIDPTTFATPVLHLDSAASFVNITDRLPQAARCDVHQDSWWWGQFGYEELPSWFQLSKHYAGVSLGIDAYFDSWIPLRTKGGTTRISGWLPESLFLLSPVSRGHTA